MFPIIFAVIILLVGLALRSSLNSKGKQLQAKLATVGTVILCVGALALSCADTVPAGHTGVVTTFGKVEDYTLDAGVHFKLPWQKVVKMDNRVQKDTVELPCFSSDIQEVNLTYTINYQIKKANAQTIYRTIGVDYYETVIQPCITESVKVVTARYTAEALVSSRSELADAIEVVLSEKLENYNIEVVKTSIENMDFTNAFTDAVEAKQVAQQNRLRAETEAKQKVIEAQAAAQIRQISADAEAYEVKAKAAAEAEANRLISDSLTQELINYTYAQTWDGKLPTVISGDGSMLPVLNINDIIETEDKGE